MVRVEAVVCRLKVNLLTFEIRVQGLEQVFVPGGHVQAAAYQAPHRLGPLPLRRGRAVHLEGGSVQEVGLLIVHEVLQHPLRTVPLGHGDGRATRPHARHLSPCGVQQPPQLVPLLGQRDGPRALCSHLVTVVPPSTGAGALRLLRPSRQSGPGVACGGGQSHGGLPGARRLERIVQPHLVLLAQVLEVEASLVLSLQLAGEFARLLLELRGALLGGEETRRGGGTLDPATECPRGGRRQTCTFRSLLGPGQSGQRLLELIIPLHCLLLQPPVLHLERKVLFLVNHPDLTAVMRLDTGRFLLQRRPDPTRGVDGHHVSLLVYFVHAG
mmetsp:Transcript_27958/g.70253  ORF Transcript_27958/g.70253 Transcript_27958/m.70253 type:complete len:327 (-) Transcript_27958:266-1246(-)